MLNVFLFFEGLFETLPGRVQCEMLLKATEQCFNTLERAEMLLLLLRRFPETVVQHGVREEKLIVTTQDIGTLVFEILLKSVCLVRGWIFYSCLIVANSSDHCILSLPPGRDWAGNK